MLTLKKRSKRVIRSPASTPSGKRALPVSSLLIERGSHSDGGVRSKSGNFLDFFLY
ncbi:hypothetical protein GQ44DRAFT_715330 [Phaeosphaeriaceae sp. PMI808]|nr:hypothetical protein GQ44DRAFT_715330 [Phaeosphaeriaceae sp. PMI808]